MKRKYKLKIGTIIKDESYSTGDVVELSDKDMDLVQVKSLLEEDRLELIEEEPEVKSSMLTKSELTQINGVGSITAQKLIDLYGTEQNLLDTDSSEIAKKVSLLTVDKVEEIKRVIE